MKTHPLHLLREDGRAICIGRKPGGMGEIACLRCSQRFAEEQQKQRKAEDRAYRKVQRALDLDAGMLFQNTKGFWGLRFMLDGKIVTESLSTKDMKKAEILAPLCMKNIRRVGRKLRDRPTCYADLPEHSREQTQRRNSEA